MKKTPIHIVNDHIVLLAQCSDGLTRQVYLDERMRQLVMGVFDAEGKNVEIKAQPIENVKLGFSKLN